MLQYDFLLKMSLFLKHVHIENLYGEVMKVLDYEREARFQISLGQESHLGDLGQVASFSPESVSGFAINKLAETVKLFLTSCNKNFSKHTTKLVDPGMKPNNSQDDVYVWV